MKDIDYRLVGRKIKERRQELGYSQEELAEKCSVSPSYIGHIERGSRKLSMPVAVRICDVLQVGLDRLFSDFIQSDDEIAGLICSAVHNATDEQRERFINAVRVLAEHIDKL